MKTIKASRRLVDLPQKHKTKNLWNNLATQKLMKFMFLLLVVISNSFHCFAGALRNEKLFFFFNL